MKLYAMRHGETDWNVAQKAQGQTDIELNKNGINQAMLARENFNMLDVDLIISSPLKRASKTAEILSNGRIEILLDDRIKERCFGDLEGTTNNEMHWDELYDYNKNISTNNIEPMSNIIDRINDFLSEIKLKYNDRNIFLVTHGGTLRVMNACVNGISEENLKSGRYKNCEIIEFNI